MGRIRRINMTRNMIYRLCTGPVESNSKSVKLSVSTYLSFMMPSFDSIFYVMSSVGTMFRVAI